VLFHLIDFLVEVAEHADTNLMTQSNLSTIFGPTLMRPEELTVMATLSDRSNQVIAFLMEHFPHLEFTTTEVFRGSSTSPRTLAREKIKQNHKKKRGSEKRRSEKRKKRRSRDAKRYTFK